MMIAIQRWLTPPVYKNEEDNFRARIMYITVSALMIMAVLVVLGNLLDSQTPVRNYVIDAAAFAALLYLRHSLSRGQLNLAGVGILLAGFAVIVATVISEGTVICLGTSEFILWIILASVFFERKGLLISSAITFLTVATLIWAELAGMLPAPTYTPTPADWFVFSLTAGLTGSLTYFIYRTTHRALVRAEQEIAARRQTEAALRQSEEQYRFLLNNTSDYITRFNRAGLLVFATDVARRFHGYAPDEILNTSSLERVHPDDRAAAQQALAEVIATGHEGHLAYRLRHKDGTFFWVEAYGRRIDNVAGEPEVIVVHRDISERKQAEAQREATLAALRASEEAFRSYFNISGVGMAVTSPEKGWITVNDYLCRMLGYTRAELLQLTWAELTHPADLAADLAFFQQVQSGERDTYELEKRFIGKNGQIVHTILSVACQRQPDRTVQHILASLVDITERQQTANIIRARLSINDYAVHHALSELLQYALDELCALTASPIGFFHFVEPDQCTLSLQAWSTRTLQEMCTAEGKGHAYDIDQAGVWVDCAHQRAPVIHNDYASLPRRKGLPEGHAPIMREMLFPIMRDQKMVAIIGVGNKAQDYTNNDVAYALRLADLIWDITERKRAEEALRELNSQLERRVADRTHELAETNARLIELGQFKDQFIDRISHELRTPLAVLKLYLGLLEKGKPEKRADYMQILRDKSAELQGKIEDLLDVSHFSLDQFKPRPAATSLNEVVHHLLTDRTELALQRELALRTDFAPDLPAITVDPILLRQVMANLLANALNYTPRHGQVTVSTGRRITTDGAWVAIEVRDTGPGLSEKDQAHLFEPFYRGEVARDYKIPGTGVGLFIARRAVEKMQGRLTVESTPGQGAAFTVWIRP